LICVVVFTAPHIAHIDDAVRASASTSDSCTI